MRKYIEKFSDEIGLSADCKRAVLCGYDALVGGRKEVFEGFISEYAENKELDFVDFMTRFGKEFSGALGNDYLNVLVLFCAMSFIARKYYAESGISEEMFLRTAADIRYKAVECKLVKGDWGIFCGTWFSGFFSLKLFAFGNLQFKYTIADRDYIAGNVVVKKGEPVLEVHIPRTGNRLNRDESLSSYKAGAEFFMRHFGIKRVVYVCSSWLLYPKNLGILKENSNIAKFISDFTIVDVSEYPDYGQVWRLFDTDYTGNADALPADTSFRRGYVDWIKRGEKTGYGVGFFVFGE